jgi:hypothetical protein
MVEHMPQLHLHHRQGYRRPTLDTELHRVPDVVGDVEEALLSPPTTAWM